MESWKKSLCGTVALRSALEGGQFSLNLQALREASDTMSCGGMYVPNWQSRFLPQAEPALKVEKGFRILHLAVQDEKQSPFLVLSYATQAERSDTSWTPAHESPVTAETQPTHTTAAMVEEIGTWWNKN